MTNKSIHIPIYLLIYVALWLEHRSLTGELSLIYA